MPGQVPDQVPGLVPGLVPDQVPVLDSVLGSVLGSVLASAHLSLVLCSRSDDSEQLLVGFERLGWRWSVGEGWGWGGGVRGELEDGPLLLLYLGWLRWGVWLQRRPE